MSLKEELEGWTQALISYEASDLPKALEIFQRLAHGSDSSKLQFNIGLIHAAMSKHQLAVLALEKATRMDKFMAVAYFQAGVSLFLLEHWDKAKSKFQHSLTYMRGNEKM